MSESESPTPLPMLEVGACLDLTVTHTVDVVTAYVGKHHVAPADLPALIRSVHEALASLGGVEPAAAPEAIDETKTPAEIRRSVTPNAITSFLDGKPYRTLKRHLGVHGLDPRSYRQRFGLPADYPMVAATYAAQRSALAKSIGLGVPAGRERATMSAAA